MYSVQQLQALDYLLKKLTSHYSTNKFLNGKNLKFVVELNNTYWYGDFVQIDKNKNFIQEQVDQSGDISTDRLYISHLPHIVKISESLTQFAKGENNPYYWTNPLQTLKSLPLLFQILTNILKDAEPVEDNTESLLYPYLLNPRSFDGKKLDFINLSHEEQIKLVSIIEVDS